jgi:hypothetical protein
MPSVSALQGMDVARAVMAHTTQGIVEFIPEHQTDEDENTVILMNTKTQTTNIKVPA